MMFGVKFKLEGLYFATFRKPTSTSLIMSYSIPPYTTIRGMISNALGLKRDDLSVQEWIKIGIKPLSFLEKSREIAKMLKLKEDRRERRPSQYVSSPIFKELLISPSYEIFIGGDKEKINCIYNALLQPMRPLYIGMSDDLVDIKLYDLLEIRGVSIKEISCIFEGIHEDCSIEKIPYKFIRRDKTFSLEYKTVSIPKKGVITLDEEVKCWEFDGENIWLL